MALLNLVNPIKTTNMESTNAPGLWLMIEEAIEPTAPESSETQNTDSFHDSYEYFPDFGI